MSTTLPDYYAILGLQRGAAPEEIKKHYRELARRYHPDVNHTPDAVQKIKSINEAYRILGDPERRATYDAEYALRQPIPPLRPTASPTSTSAGTRSSASRPTPQRPADPGPRVEFNGFGRFTPDPPPHAARPTPQARPSPPKPSAAERAAIVQKLVSEAQIAFLTRNYTDAERLCRQAIERERATPVAHEIMGDLAAMRGETDEAVKAYAYAIQYNPRNYSAQGKMDRLIGRRPSTVPGRTMTRNHGQTGLRQGLSRIPREATMTLISLFLFAGGCFVLALFGQNPGTPLGGAIPWITSLSLNLILTLFCEGVIGGVLLAFYGRLRPVSEELVLQDRTEGPKRATAPLLVILTLFSLVWFYASLLVYIGVAVGRNRFSVSALRVYGLVITLIVFFTMMVDFGDKSGSWLQTAAFSGNILFPSVLFGWFLGDCVRLRNRE